MLSDSKLKQLHGKTSDEKKTLNDRDGLYISVSPKGKVSFFIRYRFAGKPHRLVIGTYPVMTLKQARDQNLAYRLGITQGKDPKATKALLLSGTSDGGTFRELGDLWYEKQAAPTLTNHKYALGFLHAHVYPKFGSLNSSDIKTTNWLDLLESIRDKSPSVAGQILSYVKNIYAFGIRRRIVKDNPLNGITAHRDLHIKPNVVERFLNDDELKLLLKYIDKSGPKHATRALQIFLALSFGCRMSELRKAEVAHFDLDALVWTVPKENHKIGKHTNKPLKRPIAPVLAPYIKQLAGHSRNNIDFITGLTTGKKLKSNNWMSWPAKINKWLVKHGYEEIEHWTIHDLRRTLRTNISPFTQPHICEIILGHKLPKIWGTYDHYEYLPEQADAYQKWLDKIERLRGSFDNVVEINAR